MNANVDDFSPVVDRLAVRYPEHSREEIAGLVARHWTAYDHATVRAFVPVLVGREAAMELRRS